MKQELKMLLVLLVLHFSGIAGYSQEQTTAEAPVAPKWISDKGFWVIERNIHHPSNCTIYFYNNEREQVYKETITGKRFRSNKRKNLLKIKKVLETAVLAWERKQPLSGSERFFIAASKNK